MEQHNIIIDVLGGWSCELDAVLHKLLGPKSRDVLKRMQKSIISSTLNIARTFKIVTVIAYRSLHCYIIIIIIKYN